MLKKIFSILDKSNIKKLVVIFILMLINTALDLLGISIILPIVKLILDDSGDIASSPILALLSSVFNTTDSKSLMGITLLTLATLFLIKSIYAIFYSYVVNKFSLNYSKKLTFTLMNTYLGMPYEYHLENNSSTLIRKSIYDVGYFVNTINDLLSFLVKGLTFIAIFIYLLTMSPRITLIIGALFLVFSLLTIFILRPRTRKISKEVQELNSNNYKYLSQAFLGIKESKISGTERNFAKVYDENRKDINKLMLERNVYSSVPASFLEFVGILGICLSLYLLSNVIGENNFVIIETFSVFVYAVIKLLPIVISSTTIINSLAFYRKSVDTIYEDIETSRQYQINEVDEEIKEFKFDKEISINDVSFAYSSNKEKDILNKVNLKIKKNSVVAFFGTSGGGKTTLLDLVLGLLVPTKGSITVDNVDIKSNMKGWRKNISYIPQNIYLSDDTIRRNVAFGLNDDQIDDNKVKDALKKAELDEFVDSLEKKENTLIGENGIRLSGGQRQRIGIARAFYRDTNIIVFDEATSALDYETEKHIFDHVSSLKEDHTLIIVTHREESIKNSDAIYKVDNLEVTKIK